MDIVLTGDEAQILLQVLDTRLGDYSVQIADANVSAFKDQLREERGLLQQIADRLRAAS